VRSPTIVSNFLAIGTALNCNQALRLPHNQIPCVKIATRPDLPGTAKLERQPQEFRGGRLSWKEDEGCDPFDRIE